MLNFVVTVACVVHMTCPITQPVISEFKAESHKACIESAHDLIKHFGYNQKDFSIKCELK